MKVIAAGQWFITGRIWSVQGHVVAAVCCCQGGRSAYAARARRVDCELHV
jgi:hypothetical protein